MASALMRNNQSLILFKDQAFVVLNSRLMFRLFKIQIKNKTQKTSSSPNACVGDPVAYVVKVARFPTQAFGNDSVF